MRAINRGDFLGYGGLKQAELAQAQPPRIGCWSRHGRPGSHPSTNGPVWWTPSSQKRRWYMADEARCHRRMLASPASLWEAA